MISMNENGQFKPLQDVLPNEQFTRLISLDQDAKALEGSFPYINWMQGPLQDLYKKIRLQQPPSGFVRQPEHYFMTMARSDYKIWHEALFREYFQNSIDAGATCIKTVFYDPNSYDDKRFYGGDIRNEFITIGDNGSGMDRSVLLDKLLVLGGSNKGETTDTQTGTFGKAKELTLFAHKHYCLHTQNMLLLGCGGNYDIFTLPKELTLKKGTNITIQGWHPMDDVIPGIFEPPSAYSMERLHLSCKAVLEKSKTLCKIFINEELKPSAPSGTSFYEDNDFIVKKMSRKQIEKHYNNGSSEISEGGVYFTKNGLFMFQKGIESPFSFFIEMKNPSREIMLSNRDTFTAKEEKKWEKIYTLLTDTGAVKIREKAAEKKYKKLLKLDFNNTDHIQDIRPAANCTVRAFSENSEQTFTSGHSSYSSRQSSYSMEQSSTAWENGEWVQEESEQVTRAFNATSPEKELVVQVWGRATSIQRQFMQKKQNMAVVLPMWSMAVRSMQAAWEKIYQKGIDGKILPALLFCQPNKTNEGEEDTAPLAMHGVESIGRNRLITISLNPPALEQHFSWDDTSEANLNGIAHVMVSLAAHEMAHEERTSHGEWHQRETDKLFRECIKTNPMIIFDMVTAAQQMLEETRKNKQETRQKTIEEKQKTNVPKQGSLF